MRPRIKLAVRDNFLELMKNNLGCYANQEEGTKNSVSIMLVVKLEGAKFNFMLQHSKAGHAPKANEGVAYTSKRYKHALNKLFVSYISLIRSMACQTQIKYETIKITQPQAQKMGDHT